MPRSFGRGFVRDSLTDLVTPPVGNVPSLDALRSTAILMVIAYHASSEFTKLSGRGDAFAGLPLVSGGWRGVDLFFVLSGYLIGRQLWRELRTTGTIRLTRFIVLRRGLRIWPLYYFSIALWIIGSRAGREGFLSFRWWTDLVCLSNYISGCVVPPSWSLCIEEQFYLLAPLLILLLVRFTGCSSPPAFRQWLILFVITQPLLRGLTLRLEAHRFSSSHDAFASLLYAPIHLHADGLLVGILLANFADAGRPVRLRGALWWLAGAVFLAALGRKVSQPIFDFLGSALIFGSLTWLFLSLPQSSPRALGSRVCFVISRLSFGMYLEHQLIMEWMSPALVSHISSTGMPPAAADASYAVILGLAAAAAATMTYCLIERPFLRLRDHLMGHGNVLSADALLRHEPALSNPLERQGAGAM